MEALLVATAFGFGLLLVFDALVRPDAKPQPVARLRAIGPSWIAGGAAALAALVATGWPVAVLAAGVLGTKLPATARARREERAALARREAVADVSARLRDAIRSGIGLADALSQAAANAPSAIASDLKRLVSEARVSGLAAAAAAYAERARDPGAELLASALALADRLGSRNLSEVLDSLAEATAAQAATIREARARQTRARASARIVAAVPLLLLVAIRKANPAYLEPFSTPGGQAVLAFALVLIWAGYGAMRRAARIEGGAG